MIFYLGNPQEIFWESPARWSWEDVIQQPADKDNFLQLLKEFKMAFEPGRLIFRQEASAARKHKKASGLENSPKIHRNFLIFLCYCL